jgi:hypothetical protein
MIGAPAVVVMVVATARTTVVLVAARRSVMMVMMPRRGAVSAPCGEARWRSGQHGAEQQQHHVGRTKKS